MRPLLLGVLALAACAARGEPPAAPVAPELEREAILSTVPEEPLRVLFDWSMREQEARFSGRGVARIEAPQHARLDLFGPRGEGYLSAVVAGSELRLPRGVPENELPPVPLLWSALGVFQPPAGARLVRAEREGHRIHLEYRDYDDTGRWRFRLEDGKLRRAEWERSGGARHTVELEGGLRHSLPRTAVYREWLAFRELHLALDEVRDVEPFPPETWMLGR